MVHSHGLVATTDRFSDDNWDYNAKGTVGCSTTSCAHYSIGSTRTTNASCAIASTESRTASCGFDVPRGSSDIIPPAGSSAFPGTGIGTAPTGITIPLISGTCFFDFCSCFEGNGDYGA